MKVKQDLRQWARRRPTGQFVVLAKLMDCWGFYMEAPLLQSGDEWDACNVAAICVGERQKYRVLEARRAVFENAFAAKVNALISDPDQWLVLPTNCRTPRMRCLAVRMCSRALGCLNTMTRNPASGFPWVLFDPLNGSDAAGRVLRLCPRMRDDFSQYWLAQYPTPEALGGEVSRSCLATLGTEV